MMKIEPAPRGAIKTTCLAQGVDGLADEPGEG